MKKIIDPVDKEVLKLELSDNKLLRMTNAADNKIYMVDAYDSPNVMLEIGRLREYTFRMAGGGTGEEVDIDEFDTAEVPFKQLIVWSDEEEEIISAYRFIQGKEVPLDENGYPHTPTSKLFKFSKKFIENQWQDTIELGRSFVQPKYQPAVNPRLGLFSLDNIWDGLGTLVVDYPETKYFFGKMTMYNKFNRDARNLILAFLEKYFKGDESLVTPVNPVKPDIDPEYVNSVFSTSNYKADFRTLNKIVRSYQEVIPPLIKIYMDLTSTMQCFGTSANVEFGPVEETAILVTLADIYENKMIRHVHSYQPRF